MAGNLYLTAIACSVTASGLNIAAIQRAVFGPDDDFAAVAALRGTSLQCAGRYDGLVGIGQVCIEPLPAAADPDATAAVVAVGVELCTRHHQIGGGDGDLAAVLALCADAARQPGALPSQDARCSCVRSGSPVHCPGGALNLLHIAAGVDRDLTTLVDVVGGRAGVPLAQVDQVFGVDLDGGGTQVRRLQQTMCRTDVYRTPYCGGGRIVAACGNAGLVVQMHEAGQALIFWGQGRVGADVHLATTRRTCGVYGAGTQQFDALAQQGGAAAVAVAPARAERAVAHDGQAPLARCVRLGAWVVGLHRGLGPQRHGAALATTGVQRGVVHFDVALRSDLDLTALAGGASRCGVLRGLCVHAAFQFHLVRGLDAQLPALAGRAQVDAAAVRLREVRRLHLHFACAELACAGGADAAAVEHLGGADLDAPRRAAGCCGAARCGVGADAAGVFNTVAGREHDASALLLQTVGLDAATVFDDTAHQPVQRLRADDHQAARRLHRMAVVHQGCNLAGCHADAGQPVAAVKVQVHRFACGQNGRAHVRDDGALVAHLGREQGDVAA